MDAALLIVTELVTNAQRHAGGVRAFRLARTGTGVRVTVEDASPRSPVDRASPAWLPATYSFNSPAVFVGTGTLLLAAALP
ncbi:hypothetical protein AB0D15_40085, partial [Streptomyces sp. NPDC048551]